MLFKVCLFCFKVVNKNFYIMNRSLGYPNRSLFIRYIPMDTRSEDLRSVFSKYGHVKDVYIPRDYYTRKLRGFAYVEFEKLRDAENAMRNVNRIRLFGKELEVEYAQGDRKTPSEMRIRYSSRSTNYRSSRLIRRYGSPFQSRYRSRSRSRSRQRRYDSRSRSRSPSSRRHHRSFTPELKNENKNRLYVCGDESDGRYCKTNIDMIEGVISISELDKY